MKRREIEAKWKENVDWSSDDCFSFALPFLFCRCDSNQLILYEEEEEEEKKKKK
jgi:hypothetical protein